MSLDAGRCLLAALAREGKGVKDVIAAAALYQVYNLPPVAEDLASAAILADACFRGSESTLR